MAAPVLNNALYVPPGESRFVLSLPRAPFLLAAVVRQRRTLIKKTNARNSCRRQDDAIICIKCFCYGREWIDTLHSQNMLSVATGHLSRCYEGAKTPSFLLLILKTIL